MHRITTSWLLVLTLAQGIGARGLAQDEDEILKYQPDRDYGHDWKLGVLLGLTPEDGVLIGAGPILYEFGFRRLPFIYRMQLLGGGTLKTGAFKFVYKADLPTLLDHVDARIDAHASELQVRNFYGYGNASFRDEEKEDDNYYRVNSREYLIQPGIHYRLHENVSIGVAASYKHFDLRQKSGRFINTQNLDSLGNDKSLLGFGVQAGLDTRNHLLFPTGGVRLTLDAWNYPDPFHQGRPFQKLAADVRTYAGGTLLTDMVFAVRVAGEKLYGSFPFYEAAFLGGGGSLGGYFLQRFAGDASVLASANLRISLFRMKLLVPTEVGMHILGDVGRVWVDESSPGGWHSDAGGGLWFAPLSRDVIISVSAASSVDGLFVYGGLGFAF